MNYNVLTQTSGWLGPFAKVIGTIFNYLYKFFAHFGIENVGLCIVLLVIVVRVIMIPLTIKQQKFTKMTTSLELKILIQHQAIMLKAKMILMMHL